MDFFALKITNEVQSAKRKAQSECETSIPNIIIVALRQQETPGEGFLRQNSHTGLFYLPSCAFERKGVSHSAEYDKGLRPLTRQPFEKG